MSTQIVLDSSPVYVPKGDWAVLTNERQSQQLLKPPLKLNIESIVLLPLAEIGRRVDDSGGLEPSIGSRHFVPVELADYLYQNQDRIPLSWQENDVLFWTLYATREPQACSSDNKFACALTYAAGTRHWMRLYVPICSEWTSRDMIAVLH